jgi:manganese/zinc/iron transport system permease protein
MGADFVQFSLTPILIGIFASVACALPGNFLILRRQALIGDAISHVVLPGIVVAFLLTGVVSAMPMLLGAAAAAVLAVVLIEVVKRVGQVEPGAAMGVVFTTLFAAGVLLLEQSDTSSVHLDVEHALMGNLESLIWLSGPTGGPPSSIPRRLRVCRQSLGAWPWPAAIMVALTAVFWRWLKIATFDEGFAEALGIPAAAIGFGLVIASALAAVAAFEAVGSIIVIAMFICPPAAARLMTSSLERRSCGLFFSPPFRRLRATCSRVTDRCGWARRIRSAQRE